MVVVPAHEHAEDTVACLTSVLAADSHPERIIVVDDGSRDGAVDSLLEWASAQRVAAIVERGDEAHRGQPLTRGVTLLTLGVNRGFTLASNTGLRAAVARTDAPFVLLLNNDAIVAPDFFVQLHRVTEHHPDAGLLTGKILEWDGVTVWFAGGWLDRHRAIAGHELSPAAQDWYESEWISGCAMLIARPALETVGLLPRCFSPCYSEDVDYSLRVRAAGFRLIVAPRAMVVHRVGASLGRHGSQRPRVTYVSHRNRVYVVRRNFRGWERARALTYLAVTRPVRALLEALRGRPRTAWAVFAGTIDGLINPAARKSG